MNELQKIDLNEQTTAIAKKLESTLPIVEKQIAELIISKNHDTTVADLQYSGQTPLVWIQQCAMQQQNRLNGLREIWFTHKKNELKIKQLIKKGDEMSLLRAQELEAGLESSSTSIKNAMEELQSYQEQIDALRKNFNFPEVIPKEMIRENDRRERIRGAFRRALEEMSASGHIPRGTQESLEWAGIHPMVARVHCVEYIESVNQLLKDGKAPTMQHLYNFLDQMEEMYFNAVDDVVANHLKNRTLDKEE
jgi:hypothetical protein